ncbi:unnamed protein product [Ceutorhynchus assimilis]|uniref:Kinase n=1 Tax=Ceutorhynchus assimilis TaxID=467358 RepID=A0A9P0DKC2_9CUCU|nr:unnamed protein product [Ceutorhynchus assimilis]
MGKFEIQSVPPTVKPKREENGCATICAHSTCKSVHYNSLENGLRNLTFAHRVIEEESDQSAIPSGMEVLTNQVAGHVIDGTSGFGMLKKDGLVFKPLLKKDCAEREVKLYERLEASVDRSLIEMRRLVPKYHGTQKLQIKGKEIDFLILEDLTRDFKEPCIMDVKIGRRTWDPHTAPYDKIVSEERKYQACKRDLGFCVPGFQVYKLGDQQPLKFDKEYGKRLDKDTVREAMKLFLNASRGRCCRPLLMQFLAALWQIQHFARAQRRLRLYSTSILLVYDARRLREHHFEPIDNKPTLIRHRSLYRPLSLAQLNNCCAEERVPTGFSGQQTSDGPILKAPNRIVHMDSLRQAPTNRNAWQKSIHALKRTHSFQNDYDKDVQHKKDNYNLILDDLCCETKSEVWATAKMIDFAHVYTSDSADADKNYLEGVNNLIKMFEDFLAETDES